MKEILIDALKDSAEMIPFLLIIYCLVEWLERKYGESINTHIQSAAKAGPVIGAAFGCIPQCGFSVFASAMYTRQLITVGTLIAVYLSTSDEAIPVILSQPGMIHIILPLILTKVVIAIIGGYGVDLLFKNSREKVIVDQDHEVIDSIHEKGCCEHHLSGTKNKWESLIHPLVHTAKVFIFVFIVSFVINYIISLVGMEKFTKLFLPHSILQPIVLAFVGLIPNCAASVAITQIFLRGGISFGSAIAGLCSSAGLGMLVLFKENKSLHDSIRVITILIFISSTAGILIQYLWK